jgi:hypothetical protein
MCMWEWGGDSHAHAGGLVTDTAWCMDRQTGRQLAGWALPHPPGAGRQTLTLPAFLAAARSTGTFGMPGSSQGMMTPSATSFAYTDATAASRPSKESGTMAPAAFSAAFFPCGCSSRALGRGHTSGPKSSFILKKWSALFLVDSFPARIDTRF